MNVSSEFNNIDNNALRGGPALKTPGHFSYSLSLSSNSTKKLSFQGWFWSN
jgi:hypothetical protein